MMSNPDQWLSEIDLPRLKTMLRDAGAVEALYKILPKNANSKNQVYLASDFSQLGKIPSGDVTPHVSTSEKSGRQEAVFRSAVEFHWIRSDGQTVPAPDAKLIFYPQYPEVRFSGFLRGCHDAPRSLWVKEKRGTVPDRILILGIGIGQRVVGITLPPESPAAREIRAEESSHDTYGGDNSTRGDGQRLKILPLSERTEKSGLLTLLGELCRIHNLGWIDSIRLNSAGIRIPCKGTNCAGYTLEAHLGIRPNSNSEPDFKGWEVKTRLVTCIDKPNTSEVTLFTPEPDSGFYVERGIIEFINRFGYRDKHGREDRINFGGVYGAHKQAHSDTGLRLVINGFDSATGAFKTDGSILLIDPKDEVAAAWSFAKLIDKWKRKHAQAIFIPVKSSAATRQFMFGRQILLGQDSEFGLFLKAIDRGEIVYDPGIKLEHASSINPKTKKRSQFRIKSKFLPSLYRLSSIVNACNEETALKHWMQEKKQQLEANKRKMISKAD